MSLSWIAVDWGTTHLRAWGLDEADKVLFHRSSESGMGSLTMDGFEPALADLIADQLAGHPQPVDVIACGMVGSRQGWVEAPYRAVPCEPLGDLYGSVSCPAFRVHVVPGLKQDRSADVMRGEEVQIAGYLAKDKEFDGVLCLPGTHSKWVRISAGEVVSFQTAMTGEMFAVIANHTVLKHSLGEEGLNEELFLEAVSEGMAHPARLTSRLFSLRAESLLTGLKAADVRARLSGLLIGMELAATKPYWLGQRISLIGEASLCHLYDMALSEECVKPEVENGLDMTLAGLMAVYRQRAQKKDETA
ncbi:2-dehydro-3-deoxygalactonokinase [Cohaesibacter intestini]|uniref:2-dehydro-3-deoxygalactonokinase n=1 Tax=Cohaesibacter intestini TaxID=2211145 RepID=UPI000DE95139|nr:2-dehydro-3-deoxygalactonokinase [Cohaesibacter intestini]